MQTDERSKKEEEQQPPWRTEPEIEVARQEQLTRCLATTPDIQRGIYPLKGMKLSRADVEWLLATYENEGDPKARGDDLVLPDLPVIPPTGTKISLPYRHMEYLVTGETITALMADFSPNALEEILAQMGMVLPS